MAVVCCCDYLPVWRPFVDALTQWKKPRLPRSPCNIEQLLNCSCRVSDACQISPSADVTAAFQSNFTQHAVQAKFFLVSKTSEQENSCACSVAMMAQPMTALQPRVGCVCPRTSPHRSWSYVRPSRHRLRFFGGLLPVAAAARRGFTRARAQRGCRAHAQRNDPWKPLACFWDSRLFVQDTELPAYKAGDVVTGRVYSIVQDSVYISGVNIYSILAKGFLRLSVVLNCGNSSEETELELGSVIKGKVVQGPVQGREFPLRPWRDEKTAFPGLPLGAPGER